MPLLAAGQSDVGQLRLTNQDAIYLNVDKRIFVVADGMGGHNGGDIASNMAVEEISQYLLANESEDPLKNVIHASDTIEDAIKEIDLWFKPEELFEYERADDKFMFGK